MTTTTSKWNKYKINTFPSNSYFFFLPFIDTNKVTTIKLCIPPISNELIFFNLIWWLLSSTCLRCLCHRFDAMFDNVGKESDHPNEEKNGKQKYRNRWEYSDENAEEVKKLNPIDWCHENILNSPIENKHQWQTWNDLC